MKQLPSCLRCETKKQATDFACFFRFEMEALGGFASFC
jgi:hypothetical protein